MLESMLHQWPQLNRGTHAPNTKTHRLRFDGLQDDLIGGIRTRAVGAAGRGRVRAAHRVRQSGEPAARARRVAAEGVRDPLGARRRTLAAAAAVPDRRRRARARRRGTRRGARLWRTARAARGEPREHAAVRRNRARSRSCCCSPSPFRSSRACSSAWRRCCTCASRSSTSRSRKPGSGRRPAARAPGPPRARDGGSGARGRARRSAPACCCAASGT